MEKSSESSVFVMKLNAPDEYSAHGTEVKNMCEWVGVAVGLVS